MNLIHTHCTYWQSQQWKNHHVQRPHRTLGTSGQLGRCDGGQKGEPRQEAVQPPGAGPGGGGPAGAYSMSPFTSEESITSSYVRQERPDVIVNIVDATNLSRSLFFTTQLLELGIPVVVALNKHDLNEKKGTKIDISALSRALNCPVVETVSTSQKGLAQVIQAAAIGYIVKKKKSGAHCIGCPDGGSCSHCQGGGSCHCHK